MGIRGARAQVASSIPARASAIRMQCPVLTCLGRACRLRRRAAAIVSHAFDRIRLLLCSQNGCAAVRSGIDPAYFLRKKALRCP
eukprot:2164092-Rhodomonas_salina.2